MITFQTKIEKNKEVGSFTYADIPFDCEEAFGHKGNIKVKGFINGKPIKATLKPHGTGKHYIILTRGIRVKNNILVGNTIILSLQKDEEDKISIPPELESTFRKNKNAAEYFESLPSVFKKQYLKWIEDAKLETTRRNRIQLTTQKLLNREKLKANKSAKTKLV